MTHEKILDQRVNDTWGSLRAYRQLIRGGPYAAYGVCSRSGERLLSHRARSSDFNASSSNSTARSLLPIPPEKQKRERLHEPDTKVQRRDLANHASILLRSSSAGAALWAATAATSTPLPL